MYLLSLSRYPRRAGPSRTVANADIRFCLCRIGIVIMLIIFKRCNSRVQGFNKTTNWLSLKSVNDAKMPMGDHSKNLSLIKTMHLQSSLAQHFLWGGPEPPPIFFGKLSLGKSVFFASKDGEKILELLFSGVGKKLVGFRLGGSSSPPPPRATSLN